MFFPCILALSLTAQPVRVDRPVQPSILPEPVQAQEYDPPNRGGPDISKGNGTR